MLPARVTVVIVQERVWPFKWGSEGASSASDGSYSAGGCGPLRGDMVVQTDFFSLSNQDLAFRVI